MRSPMAGRRAVPARDYPAAVLVKKIVPTVLAKVDRMYKLREYLFAGVFGYFQSGKKHIKQAGISFAIAIG